MRMRWCRTVVVAMSVLCTGAFAGAAAAKPPIRVSPFAQGHAYRHGAVPRRGRKAAGTTTTYSSKNLSYGGGVSGVGVTTGPPKVYLVFWGSQWTKGSTTAGTITSAGDPSGMAPDVEKFMQGVGTGNETWSGVMTQYCQGVSTGAQSCPSTAAHVGYPSGGALAGVWVDDSSAAPAQATGNQIGAEAVKAAGYFASGNTSVSYRNAQFVIISPTGTHPDGFNTSTSNFCAWHDYTGDTTLSGGPVSSPQYGPIAFTNLPYIPDAGASCGQNFVNAGSAGTLDGVTIVEGHEYAETITDQFPAGGWVDNQGEENGDKCAWISSGSGRSQNITLSTGTFAVQTTWANDGNTGKGACEVSHPVVGGGSTTSNTVSVTNPGNQTSTAGSAVSLQINASDSGGSPLTYSATLPAGLSINSSSGLISGTPTTAGTSTATVTATDSTGAVGSTSFTWTVNASSTTGCTAQQLLGNPGFETGAAAPWTTTAGVIQPSSAGEPAHSGNYVAWLDGYGTTHTDTLAQQVSIPAGCANYTLSFWLHIDTAETTTTTAYDKLTVQVLSSSGTVLGTLGTFSNLNKASGYLQHSYNLAAYAGQTVTLKFTGSEDSSLATSFVVDDTALNVS